MLTKTATDIIKEAALSEDFHATDMVSDELKTKYNQCIEEMSVISKDLIFYNSKMIPVFESNGLYYVELDNVAKYMDSANVTDIKEAMDNIAYANEIEESSLSLVIESKQYMEDILQEAVEMSKAGNKALLEDCEVSMKLLNLLQAEGIRVCLKESDKFIDESFADIKDKVKQAFIKYGTKRGRIEAEIEKSDKFTKQAEDELARIEKMDNDTAAAYVSKKVNRNTYIYLGHMAGAGVKGGVSGALIAIEPLVGYPVFIGSLMTIPKEVDNLNRKGYLNMNRDVTQYKKALSNTIKINKNCKKLAEARLKELD